MTTTQIDLAFDADLQPIGYARTTELVRTDLARETLPAGPDLFGWELAPQRVAATPTDSPADWAPDHAGRSGAIA
jgi:hypothetical protein